MKVIDTEKWSRKASYDNFSTYTNPTFSIGTRLDVTKLVEYCKANERSFFKTFLYVLSRCANNIEELRTRIVDGKVVLFDVVHPSYVILRDDHSISTTLTELCDDYEHFCDEAGRDIEDIKLGSKERPYNERERADCIYISNMPWVDVTDFMNPYNLTDARQTSIPRITWGKYVRSFSGGYEMGFNVSAHHALVDGYHVARLILDITAAIENIEEYLREK